MFSAMFHAPKGAKMILKPTRHHEKAVPSIVITLILWILSGVGVFLLSFFSYFGVVQAALIATLIMSAIALVLMIWPMCEYLFIFHNPIGLQDHYKWWLCPLIACLIDLPVIAIASAALLQFGWATLIVLVALFASAWIPRLCFHL
ncbi:MAG: hypothetical protein K5695_12295 [Oscillospiraceae bacterium]|nr:hypothetical protein [Oscillospiraceae bacterium]